MVLVVIPVHERGELVRHCLRSAAELDLPAGSEVLVIDDASPRLDVPALIAGSGLHCQFERLSGRVGADGMVAEVWRRFIASSHDHLFFLDSDMVANRDAVTVALRLARRFDGLLGLYNSIAHQGEVLDDELVLKPTVGNAATLWTRELAAIALAAVEPGVRGSIDHAYCRVFAGRGIRIAVTARSRVQHIGIYGTNNERFGALEHGRDFRPDSPAQWEAIGFVYDDLMRRQRDFLRPRSLGERIKRRLKRLLGQ
jgi:hypothetical protein